MLSLGIEVCIPKICHAIVLCSTTDLPAQAKLLNFTQFNGAYGCATCKHPGEVVVSGRGTTRAYRYQEPPFPCRTSAETKMLGKRALRNKMVCIHER